MAAKCLCKKVGEKDVCQVASDASAGKGVIWTVQAQVPQGTCSALVAKVLWVGASEAPLSQDLDFLHKIFSLVTPGQLGGHVPPKHGQVKQIVVLRNKVEKQELSLQEVMAQLYDAHVHLHHQCLKVVSLPRSQGKRISVCQELINAM